jgi:hypothetical protein
MESASTLSPKLPAPCPAHRAFLPRAGLALLLAGGTAAWLWGRLPPWEGRMLFAVPLLAALGCSIFWNWHLRAGSVPKGWAAAYCLLFFSQMVLFIVRFQPSPSASLEAIGSGNFVYLLFWTFGLHEREPGLRPLATFALMMSVGILAMPAVVIGGVLLSLAFFLNQRKTSLGAFNLFLLLFTPALLCVMALVFMDIVSWGSIHNTLSAFRVNTHSGSNEKFWMLPWEGPVLVCGVLLTRLLEGKSRSCDVALIALLFFLATVGRAHWMPNALSFFDLSIIAFAGASCFVSLSPPQSRFMRMTVLSALSLGLALVLCNR